MSQQTIDTTTQTDLLYQGFEKVNDNFTEVYASIVQTGMMIDYWGTSAPSGWVLADGLTIGKSGSGASRANADTENLFILLWNSLSDSVASVSSGRGISASADFAAGKMLTLPQLNGKTSVGKASSGTFATLGESVGSETHTLTEAELPIVAGHTHTQPTHTHDVTGGTIDTATISGSGASVFVSAGISPFTTNSSGGDDTGSSGGFGSGTAHNNIQPSIVCNKIIKL